MTVFMNFLIEGRAVTWIIFALGLVAMVIVIERLLHLHRAEINVPEFLRGVTNALKRNNTIEAVSICDETPGPVAHLLRSAILRCEKGELEMRKAVEDASLDEIPRLEKGVRLLATIAVITPLLGFLGTVIGMMTVFQQMGPHGAFVTTAALSNGIWTALISSASGLVVAIPLYGFHNYFVARIDSLILDMEKASSELIYVIKEHNVHLGNADFSAADEEEEETAAKSSKVKTGKEAVV